MTTKETFATYRPHPWHGLEVGPDAPSIVTAYIESVPGDGIKYEIDKETGYLMVDRPHRTSSLPPTLYGFIPKTYCHDRVAALMYGADEGDGDPLDICVFSERPIDRTDIILHAKVIGGMQMLDDGEADDKIIAVIVKDHMWGDVDDIEQFPERLVERIKHYFETYKLVPGKENRAKILSIYGREHALKVVEASMADYNDIYGG